MLEEEEEDDIHTHVNAFYVCLCLSMHLYTNAYTYIIIDMIIYTYICMRLCIIIILHPVKICIRSTGHPDSYEGLTNHVTEWMDAFYMARALQK